MRKSLTVGMIREARIDEPRAPLTPQDVLWLRERRIKLEVQSSPARIFKDKEYKKCGAVIVDRFRNASLILGIKEPAPLSLINNTVYMAFSHTSKGSPSKMYILSEAIRRGVTLIDYEKIADADGKRLVYFGRMAGVCGTIDALHYLGKKLRHGGIKNPFAVIKPAYQYPSLKSAMRDMAGLSEKIRRNGLDSRLSPFIIGLTGHGRVSQGAAETLSPLCPIEIHPRDMQRFVRHQKKVNNRVYSITFLREEKFRGKEKRGFYFEEYLKYPERFESNLDRYLPHLNLLINGAYWDARYPRLVTREMARKLYKKNFRLSFISDISCDIAGSVELTYKAVPASEATYTYDPEKDRFSDGYRQEGITILARDNLPSELPKESSREFSRMIREYAYQIAAHGVTDITNHTAIPAEVRRAVMVQRKKLSPPYAYLKKAIERRDI